MTASRSIRHIVFYGTLASGEREHDELGLPRALTPLGPRILAGTLYDLGRYPGMVAGDGRVAAELYRIDDVSVLRRLDAYEGFDAADRQASLFVRSAIEVPRFGGGGGPRVSAWVYLYNGAVVGEKVVPGESWGAYRARGQRRLPVISRYRSSRRFAPASRRS